MYEIPTFVYYDKIYLIDKTNKSPKPIMRTSLNIMSMKINMSFDVSIDIGCYAGDKFYKLLVDMYDPLKHDIIVYMQTDKNILLVKITNFNLSLTNSYLDGKIIRYR